MSEAAAAESPKVMEKVFNILKRELSAEEYLVYLQTITPRIGDATAKLRDISKLLRAKALSVCCGLGLV